MQTRLTYRRCEEIKRIATDTIIRHDIGCAPLDGFELADKLGIKLVKYSSMKDGKRLAHKQSKDGFFVRMPDGTERIYYNEYMMPERRNFTMLHEIGHVQLRHGDVPMEFEEEEANLFAKYAVAPPVLVDYFKADTPEKIAARFRLSHEASEYSCNFYHKWLRNTRRKLADYETTLLRHALWHGFAERCKKIGTVELPYDCIDEPMFPVSREWFVYGKGLPWELPAQA